ERALSLERSSSIVGLATVPTPGVPRTLSHISLMVGIDAATSFASALLVSGGSRFARVLISPNCDVASLSFGKADCALAASVMPGRTDFRLSTDVLIRLVRLPMVMSEGATPTVATGGLVAERGNSATVSLDAPSTYQARPPRTTAPSTQYAQGIPDIPVLA